jgi:membrane-associated phospholipid phosphatase
LLSYPAAFAVGFGMIAGDHHWTSDVLAGGLIGQAIGYSVGRNFRKRLRADQKASEERERTWLLMPLPGARYGASLVGFW